MSTNYPIIDPKTDDGKSTDTSNINPPIIDHNPAVPITPIPKPRNEDEMASGSIIHQDPVQTEPTISEPAYGVVSIPEYTRRYLNPNRFRALTARIPYPHMALGSFARAFRDYIHYSVYRDFSALLFGAYNKSIQAHLQRRHTEADDGTIGIPDIKLPLFTYTMQIEGVDEKYDMPWRSTTYFPALSRVVYPSFYSCEDFELKVIFRRLKGTINSTIYCSSEAELLDIQMAFIDGFRGQNVYNQIDITAMTVLPNELLFTDIHGRRISKALTSNNITKSFVPAVNGNYYYIANNISAIINMQNITQASNYYGGSAMPEYILNGSFNFEIEIPHYILALAKEEYDSIEIGIDVFYKFENDKVIQAIRYITGKPLEDTTPTDNEILQFENGEIIDKVAYTVPQDNTIKIPLMKLFENPSWSCLNNDIIVMIIYSGGVIRLPIDNAVAHYDDEGNIVLNEIERDGPDGTKIKEQIELFNAEDFLEIYIFKLKVDLEF